MREFLIPLAGACLYEPGAALVALLAFPKATEAAELEAARRAICALAARSVAEWEEEWGAAARSLVRLGHLRVTDREIKAALHTYERRLQYCMAAGKMGNAFLMEASSGMVPPLPNGGEALSIAQLAKGVMDDVGLNDEKNVAAKVWREHLSVVHLAAATQILLSETKRLGGQVYLADIIWTPALVTWIFERAEALRALFAASRYERVDPDALIRVKLVKRAGPEELIFGVLPRVA